MCHRTVEDVFQSGMEKFINRKVWENTCTPSLSALNSPESTTFTGRRTFWAKRAGVWRVNLARDLEGAFHLFEGQGYTWHPW